jgi:hypothetical protein
MVMLVAGIDDEGWRFLVVKRAVGLENRTLSLEIESVGGNQVDDVGGSQDLLNSFIRDPWHRSMTVARDPELPIYQVPGIMKDCDFLAKRRKIRCILEA